MTPRSRSLFRWTVGTLVFGSAFVLIDVALYHFWHLRRRSAPAEWHLRIAAGTGAAAILLTYVGVRLLRRWQVIPSRGATKTGNRPTPPEA